MSFQLRLKPEEQIQVTVVQYLRTKYPDALFTVSPITKLSYFQGMKQKMMGYSKGTPDIMIFEPNKAAYGLFIELKTDKTSFTKKGTVSVEQKEWQISLCTRGYLALTCYGVDEACKVIDKYFEDK